MLLPTRQLEYGILQGCVINSTEETPKQIQMLAQRNSANQTHLERLYLTEEVGEFPPTSTVSQNLVFEGDWNAFLVFVILVKCVKSPKIMCLVLSTDDFENLFPD